MATPHKYPTGRAGFESIITEGYLYVDKTERMYEMIGDRKFVFLSRPRRFGKSLLVNTLRAYFEGKKELFKGLKIYDLEKDWIQYPVIKLDMSSYKDMLPDEMRTSIADDISKMEIKYSITPNDNLSNGARFKNLIETAKSQTGRNVVVLIDEYDAPLNAHLYDGKLNDVKPKLQEIYQQLKVLEDDERFVFITGISKYLILDNLSNLSMRDEFADICGFTKKELATVGGKEVEPYKFSASSMLIYNPAKIFGEETNDAIPDFIKQSFSGFEKNKWNGGQFFADDFYCNVGYGREELAILYQHGYLTIKDCDQESKVYTLGWTMPNLPLQFRN